MSPKFVFRSGAGSTPPSPEELFADLPRPADGPPYLWSHQADLLRAYREEHLETPDLALELPTGAGKTLVGQLIGEWRRRARQERVAYLCPTQQLVNQTAAQAHRNGMPVVVLMDDHKLWQKDAVHRFHASEAMVITTYSTVFNSSPKLGSIHVFILDDAHAGESYVADAWSMTVSRRDSGSLLAKPNPLYHALIDLFGDRLDPVFVEMMRDEAPDPAWLGLVEQVPPEHLYARSTDIFTVLTQQEGQHRFPLTRMAGHFGACLAFVSWAEILIRPLIPPTFSHDEFNNAVQRVYMSATLGESGELERAFGRPKIARLPIPRGWESHGAGRRFFVFTERATDAEGVDVTGAVLQEVRKALLLSPDQRSSTKAREALGEGLPIYDKNDIRQSMVPFATAGEGILALTSRYDGIDLPGTDCRVVVLDGLPAGVHLQERFIVNTLGAARALQERIRTRIVQGAGRCTRSPSDYAVILVTGDKITNFCGQAEVQKAIHPELQAEIGFGWDNSPRPLRELVDNVLSFLRADPVWQEQVEPRLAEQRAQMERVLPPAAQSFGNAAPAEVLAIDAAWSGAWSKAVEQARAAATVLELSSDARAYSALWLFLAAEWAAIGALEEGRSDLRTVSQELLEQAIRTAPKTGWMNRPPAIASEVVDQFSEALITGALEGFGNRTLHRPIALETACADLESLLDGTESDTFERGLVGLGTLLGFMSARHDQDAAPDVEWAFPVGPWIAIEAKSGEKPQGEIGARTIDQANRHLRWMALSRGQSVPQGSLSIIATPRTTISKTNAGLAGEFVRIVDLEEIRQLAGDAINAWRQILGRCAGLDGDDLVGLVRERFERNGILGVKVLERLGHRHPAELVAVPPSRS